MQELIKYISDILNIKTDSVYTIQDMTEELSKIRDIAAYRSYIKDHIKSIDYTSGYQKFILLTQKYLRLEYKALNPEAGIKAKEVAELAYTVITNGKYNGLASHYVSGVEEERKLLSSIGGANYIQELLDNDTLEDMIVKKIMEKENALPYEQLPERMATMLANSTKAIK
jgi:hypothetical protein